MKPNRILPVPLVCFLAAGLLGPVPARAADDDQAAHKAAAADVVKAMHLDGLFATTTERMMTMVDRMSDGAARQIPDKTAAADFQTRMHTQGQDMLKKSFNWEAVEPQFIHIYESSFTTEELKNLAVFYNTPLGQKLVAKQPELSDQMGKASQQRAQQVMPQIINMVRSESAKLQPPKPPGAPGTPVVPGAATIPGPPGAPGPFAVPPPPPPGLGQPPMPPAAPPFAVPPAPPAAAPASTAAPSTAATPAVNPAPKSLPSTP